MADLMGNSGGLTEKPGAARKTPAVLINGEVSALAVARSLSRAGVPVYALGRPDDPLRHSRHRIEYVDVGGGAEAQRRILEWLSSQGPVGAVLLPGDDDGLELIARNRARLVALGYVPFEADDEVLLAMLDKERTYELCRAAGIPAPRTFVVGNRDEALSAAVQTGYPCAIKPRVSHLWRRHFETGKALVVSGPEELAEAADRIEGVPLDVILTELIGGSDDRFCSYYSYLDTEGRPLFDLTKRKLRQLPAGFGLGTFHRMDWNPEVAAAGRRFFRAMGVRGLACVEFKRDPRDGRLVVIECNHRFTGCMQLVHDSGADLALFTYNQMLGLPTPPIEGYRTGLTMWSPVQDVLAIPGYRRLGQFEPWAWLRSVARPHCFAAWRITDPLPSIFRGARKVRSKTRRVWRLRRHRPWA